MIEHEKQKHYKLNVCVNKCARIAHIEYQNLSTNFAVSHFLRSKVSPEWASGP